MKQVVQDNIDILQGELQAKFGKKCKVNVTKTVPACDFWVGRYLTDGTRVSYFKSDDDLIAFMEGLISEGKLAEGTITKGDKIFFYNASGERVR